jgi:lipoprotein NlpI
MTRAICVMVLAWLVCPSPVVESAPADEDVAQCETFKLATGDADTAIEHCSRAIRAGGLSDEKLAHLYYKRGNAFSKKRENQRALQDYDHSILLNPRYPNAYFNRGQTWHELKDYDRAIADHSEVLRFNPKDAEAYYFRGWGYFEKEDYDRAIADYDTSIRLKPKFEWSRIHRGIAWEKKDDLDRALADFDTAVRLAPQDAFAFSHRGRARFFKGQFDAAAADFAKANELKGDNPYFLIWLYLARGHIDATEAKREFERLAPQVDMQYWPAAVVSLLLGSASPEEVLKRAAYLDSDAHRWRVCEADYYLGEWHLIRGTKELALPLFRTVKDECPTKLSEYTGAVIELRRIE